MAFGGKRKSDFAVWNLGSSRSPLDGQGICKAFFLRLSSLKIEIIYKQKGFISTV